MTRKHFIAAAQQVIGVRQAAFGRRLDAQREIENEAKAIEDAFVKFFSSLSSTFNEVTFRAACARCPTCPGCEDC